MSVPLEPHFYTSAPNWGSESVGIELDLVICNLVMSFMALNVLTETPIAAV